MIKLKDILNEGTEDSIRDAYYNFGDGLEELNMLATNILKGDNKFKNLVSKLYRIDDQITRYLDKNYKGWD